MTPFTPDELEAIDADLSDGEQSDPLADGVTEERATRWAVFDRRRQAYLEATVRARPPTDRMRTGIYFDELGEYEGDRFVWHRV